MDTLANAELDPLLMSMVQSSEGVSDLLFVVGKPPQVEVHGRLKAFLPESAGEVLTSGRIEGFARAIMNRNPRLIQELEDTGSCDCSYSLLTVCRFRVNIYRQNGNFAMVLRRLQTKIPSMDSIRLPPAFHEIIKEKNGLIFVTGGTGSGKTTTLAALLNEINRTSEVHVVTLEDPVEFLHPHLQATFSQREFGRDFFTFPDGLRAALRQAPKIILVGEIRDRETMDIVLTAAETGHVVYSTLHTISAAQTINRILGMFGKDEEQLVRERLAGTLRYIVSQRLVPREAGGRMLMTELMGSNLRTREAIVLGENENRRLAEIIEGGNIVGWHSFEQSLIKAFEEGSVSEETAILYCINKPRMRQMIDAVTKRRETTPMPITMKMKVEESAPRERATLRPPLAKPSPTPPPSMKPPTPVT